jgi:hypothetical protein
MKKTTISIISQAVDNLVEARLLARKHKLGRIHIARRMQAIKILQTLEEKPNLCNTDLRKLFGGTMVGSALSSLRHCGAIIRKRVMIPRSSVTGMIKHKSIVQFSLAPNAMAVATEAMTEPWF